MTTRSPILALALALCALALPALAGCRSERADEARPQTLERFITGGDPVYLPPGKPHVPGDEPVSTTTVTSSDLCSGEVRLRTDDEAMACDGGTPLVEKP